MTMGGEGRDDPDSGHTYYGLSMIDPAKCSIFWVRWYRILNHIHIPTLCISSFGFLYCIISRSFLVVSNCCVIILDPVPTADSLASVYFFHFNLLPLHSNAKLPEVDS